MTIGMSVTVSETDVPISDVSPRGRMSARPSASGSRNSCVSSFRAWAMMRRIRWPSGGDGAGSAFFGDHQEDVFQRIVFISRIEHTDTVRRQPGRDIARGRLRIAV